MFDKYIYNFLMWVNHWSTKITSWSWCMLYSDRKKDMETKEDIKIREILEKEEPLQKKKKQLKPQFGVGSSA